jgi:hypothetical protein
MLYRPAGPDHLHRGLFVSPDLPQDLSHFETFFLTRDDGRG